MDGMGEASKEDAKRKEAVQTARRKQLIFGAPENLGMIGCTLRGGASRASHLCTYI